MEAVPFVIAVLLAAIGVGYAMSRASKLRKEFPDLAPEKPQRLSKRQKRLEQIRANEPEYVPPSLDDLIAAEIRDERLDEIAGSVDLAPAVVLQVYRRDQAVADACPREKLRYVVAGGVDPGEAGVDDVRLVCDSEPGAPAQ